MFIPLNDDVNAATLQVILGDEVFHHMDSMGTFFFKLFFLADTLLNLAAQWGISKFEKAKDF